MPRLVFQFHVQCQLHVRLNVEEKSHYISINIKWSGFLIYFSPLFDMPWSEVKINAVFPSGNRSLNNVTIFETPLSTSLKFASNNLYDKNHI